MDYLLCLDSTPNLFGLFDTTIAPPLLYYSYIPIILISLLFGLFVYRSAKSIQNILFLSVTIAFAVFIINEIVQWIAVPTSIVHLGWEIAPFFHVLITLLLFYFVYVFVYQKDLSFINKILIFLVALPVLVLLPTNLNMESFDLLNCQANAGHLFSYVYLVEVVSILLIIFMCLKRIIKEQDNIFKKQIFLIMSGSVLFMFFLAGSNILGEITSVYEINLVGPIGTVAFLGLLTYMIVNFQTFNMKVIATEALVWALLTLIGAQFFFIKVFTNYVLTAITFLTTFILGNYLIGSVRREVAQRERLAVLLKERENLEHLISHKVKGSFTRSKFVFAEMLDGSFGELTDKMREMAQGGLDANNSGIKTVDLILNSFNLQAGVVRFEMNPLDFKSIVEEVANEKRGPAEAKGLKFEVSIEEGRFNVVGDAFWLKEVVNNLVENSTRYTLHGFIKVELKREDGKAILAVSDSGVGITEEDRANLFKQGGRGKDSVKINTDSTGYGLYSVKMILDAHKGSIDVQSSGKDQGSKFTVSLDLVE